MTTITVSGVYGELVEAGFTFHSDTPHDPHSMTVECEFHVDSWGSTGNGWDDPGEAAEYHMIDVTVTLPDNTLVHTKTELSQEQSEWLENHFNDEVQQACFDYDHSSDFDDNYF